MKYLFVPTTQYHKSVFNERQLQECWCLSNLLQNHRNSFYFLLFFPLKEYTTNCCIWSLLQQLWQREAKDISEFVLPELLPPLWLRGLTDNPFQQTEQMKNFTQEWNQHCRIKKPLTLIFTDILFFILFGLCTYYSQDQSGSDKLSQ